MIKEFTSLRFIFFVIIFLHHCNLYEGGGNMGVVMFFVLSGFCYALGYHEKVMKPDFSYKEYILRKFRKFYPLHWILLIIAAIWILTGSYTTRRLLISLPFNFSLTQSWIPVSYVYFSYNPLSWYLSDTVFFILICPFLLLALQKCKKIGLAFVAVLAIVIYVLLWIFLPDQYTHAIFYIHPVVRLYDFVIGLALGLIFLNIHEKINVKCNNKLVTNLLKASSILSFIGLVAISVIYEENLHAVIYWPLASTMLLCIAFTSGKWKLLNIPILQQLGNHAFTFYMIHYLCIHIGRDIFQQLGIENVNLSYTLIFVIIIGITYFADRISLIRQK